MVSTTIRCHLSSSWLQHDVKLTEMSSLSTFRNIKQHNQRNNQSLKWCFFDRIWSHSGRRLYCQIHFSSNGRWKFRESANYIRWYVTIRSALVPLLLSQPLYLTKPTANSDEGTAFSPRGVNTTSDFTNLLLADAIPAPLVSQLLAAYPDDPSVNVIASLGSSRPGLPYGSQFRRSASYYGDSVFIAARRLTCQTWASYGVPAYCYRFNAITSNVNSVIAVTHYQEVAFVFNNLLGVGYPPLNPNPFEGKGEGTVALAGFMSSSWAGFVSDLDPNSWRTGAGWNGSEAAWPKYEIGNPMNIVLDANVSSYAEPDTYRAEGMKLINDNNFGVYRR